MVGKREKKTDESDAAATAKTGIGAGAPDRRMTRSMGKAKSGPFVSLEDMKPAKKAKKTPPEKKASEKGKAVAEEEEEGEEEEVIEPTPEGTRKIVIEHCKQCNSFKTRANLAREGLEAGFPGIKVLVNPGKPRKGCFEIREENGETFLTLLNLKRPFPELKALDMNEVVSDVLKKLKV